MKRRHFLHVLGGAALSVPLTAGAQQLQGKRRVGALLYLAADDAEAQLYTAAFVQGLQELGWAIGRNLEIDFRWTHGDAELVHKYASELVARSPDVILAAGGSHVGPLQQASRTVPIVFVQVTDPVGGGFVSSLARPGGNATGFTVFEFEIGAKWLELLKQMAPRVTRVAVLRDPANPSGIGLFGAIQTAAPHFGVEVFPVSLGKASEIERGLAAFADTPNGGLIVTASGLAIVNRGVIVKLAAQLRLPAIYPFRDFALGDGLASYGPDVVDQYRRAAAYVDRILKGEAPAGLPVQASARFELVINLKTAKTLDLTVPQSLLAGADEVIE